MKRFGQIEIITAVIMIVTSLAVPAGAAITWSGDVDPSDPSTWNSGTTGYIGKTGSGTMSITGGSDVIDSYGYIGREAGSTGTISVDGVNSTWTNGRDLHVGSFGNGTLNITDGGAVTVVRNTWVGAGSSSSGVINFNNGTLTTGGLGCATTDLTGTGTINTSGMVSDLDLVFDASNGLDQTLKINDNAGQDITVNLSADGSATMGAGFSGNGTMSISDGMSIESTSGYIGFKTGSTGEVTVDGVDSTWIIRDQFFVGARGDGTLNITGGGTASNDRGNIGYESGSTGIVTVDGADSTWTNRGYLNVGIYGDGTLNITNGGMVSNGSGYNSHGAIGFYSGSTSVVNIDGTDSTWTNGGDLYVGYNGNGTLEITDGALVSVAGLLTIDSNGGDDSFINMATGGMLALFGDADESLAQFMGLIDGSDAIRYWDESIAGWADITGATRAKDYTLEYLTEGDLAGYTMLTVAEPVVPISLDIKPGSCPNPVNVKSKGMLPVAILGTEEFEVSTIDAASIFLNGVPAIRSSYEDVAGPVADPNKCECTTEAGDGFDDLVLKFKTQDIVETLGEVNTGDILTLPLTGVLNNGTSIEGADCVVIVGRHKPINKADINKDGVVNTVDIAIVAENWLESSIVEE